MIARATSRCGRWRRPGVGGQRDDATATARALASSPVLAAGARRRPSPCRSVPAVSAACPFALRPAAAVVAPASRVPRLAVACAPAVGSGPRSPRGLEREGVTDLHLAVPTWRPHGPAPEPGSWDAATQPTASRSEVGR